MWRVRCEATSEVTEPSASKLDAGLRSTRFAAAEHHQICRHVYEVSEDGDTWAEAGAS